MTFPDGASATRPGSAPVTGELGANCRRDGNQTCWINCARDGGPNYSIIRLALKVLNSSIIPDIRYGAAHVTTSRCVLVDGISRKPFASTCDRGSGETPITGELNHRDDDAPVYGNSSARSAPSTAVTVAGFQAVEKSALRPNRFPDARIRRSLSRARGVMGESTASASLLASMTLLTRVTARRPPVRPVERTVGDPCLLASAFHHRRRPPNNSLADFRSRALEPRRSESLVPGREFRCYDQ